MIYIKQLINQIKMKLNNNKNDKFYYIKTNY